jgi:N12 class adenine-specific DNA methylase
MATSVRPQPTQDPLDAEYAAWKAQRAQEQRAAAATADPLDAEFAQWKTTHQHAGDTGNVDIGPPPPNYPGAPAAPDAGNVTLGASEPPPTEETDPTYRAALARAHAHAPAPPPPPAPPAPIQMPPVVVKPLMAPAVIAPPTMAVADANAAPRRNPHARKLTGLAKGATDVFEAMANNPVSTATALPLAPLESALTAGRYIGQQITDDPEGDVTAQESMGIPRVSGKEGAFAALQVGTLAGGPLIGKVVGQAAARALEAAGASPVVARGIAGTAAAAAEGGAVGAAYDPEKPLRGGTIGAGIGVLGNEIGGAVRRRGAAPPEPPQGPWAHEERQLPGAKEPGPRVVADEPVPPPSGPDYEVEPGPDFSNGRVPDEAEFKAWKRAQAPRPPKAEPKPFGKVDIEPPPALADVETATAAVRSELAQATDPLVQGELSSRLNMLEAQGRKLRGEPEPEMAGAEANRERLKRTGSLRDDVPPKPAPAPEQQEAPKIIDISGMGTAISDNLYDMLWEKVQKGITTEAGAPSTVLQVAKAIRDRGGVLDRDRLKQLAAEVQRVKDAGGPTFQRDLGAVAARYLGTPITDAAVGKAPAGAPESVSSKQNEPPAPAEPTLDLANSLSEVQAALKHARSIPKSTTTFQEGDIVRHGGDDELWRVQRAGDRSVQITRVDPSTRGTSSAFIPPGMLELVERAKARTPAPAQSIAEATTGVPLRAPLLRGQGKGESPYNPLGAQVPILGEGRYGTTDREYAQHFGPTITEHVTDLANPLVIDSDAQWRALTAAAGWKHPNPFGQHPDAVTGDIARLRARIERMGHDGVVVRIPPDEATGKTLSKVFGADQVLEFKPSAPAPAPASEEVAAPAAPAQAGTSPVLSGPVRDATPSGKAPKGKVTPIDVRNAGVGVRNEAQERLHDLITAAHPGDREVTGRAAQAIGDMIDRDAPLAEALRKRGVRVTPEIEAQANHLEQLDRATRMADLAAGIQPWKHVQRAREILRAQGVGEDEIKGLTDTALIERAFQEAPSTTERPAIAPVERAPSGRPLTEAEKAKKPPTPQVPAMPGMSPLGATPTPTTETPTFAERYEKELRAELAKNPSSFAYGYHQIPGVVSKMMAALAQGNANWRGSAALKRAAKAHGVPFTREGLQTAAQAQPAPASVSPPDDSAPTAPVSASYDHITDRPKLVPLLEQAVVRRDVALEKGRGNQAAREQDEIDAIIARMDSLPQRRAGGVPIADANERRAREAGTRYRKKLEGSAPAPAGSREISPPAVDTAPEPVNASAGTTEAPDGPVRRDLPERDGGTPPEGVRAPEGDAVAPRGSRGSGGASESAGVQRAPRAPEAVSGASGLPEPGATPSGVEPAGAGDRDEGPGGPGAGSPRAERARADRPAGNYVLTSEAAAEIIKGGPATKAGRNVQAIELLKEIEAARRPATTDEQRLLSLYTGWGGIPQAFDPAHPKYESTMGPNLRALLTDEEWNAARASTPNAHYTSPAVIERVHALLNRLGFEGGRILEPSMGAGYFLGLTPAAHRSDYKWTGVELDQLTGRIARLLYPDADVHVAGFQDLQRPDGFFDTAIGNVPFGNYRVNDPRYNKLKLSIHNYFFRKTLDLVRPGGVVAFITSPFTMDAKGSAVRAELAKHADLLGAIRLPSVAFKGIAGTDVTTDLLVLRKRAPGEDAAGEGWTKSVPKTVPGREGDATINLNEYFHAHPENILGELRGDGTMNARFGDESEMTVKGDVAELPDLLRAAVARFPQDGYTPDATSPAFTGGSIPQLAPDTVRERGLVAQGPKIMRRENGVLVDAKVPAPHVARVKQLIQLRDLTARTLQSQLNDEPDAVIERERKALDTAYTAFVKAHGPIRKEVRTDRGTDKAGNPITQVRFPNLAHFDDAQRELVAALEHYDPETGTAKKADILERRVVPKKVPMDRADSPADALPMVLAEMGRVDVPRIAQLTGVSQMDAVRALKGQIFEDPTQPGRYLTRDQYTSGDVKTKLAEAREGAKTDPTRWAPNIEALEPVIPKDLLPSQITATLGARWIPTSDYVRFVKDVLGNGHVTVQYTPAAGIGYKVEGDYRVKTSVANTTEFGTTRKDALELLELALNLQTPTVYGGREEIDGKTVEFYDHDKDKATKNPIATVAAQEKQEALKDRFERWVWEDQKRSERLAATYNEQHNRVRLVTPDGSHMQFPGMASHIHGKPFNLRKHQKDAAWRIIQEGNTLLAHEVGTGKTYTMVAASMEAKRLGLAKKPMHIVLKHMLGQYAAEFQQAYPAANLLVATEEDFAKENRREFVARAAQNNWDAIIMGQSSFERIPMSEEFQREFIARELAELESAYREAKAAGISRATLKQIEKAKLNLQAKLGEMAAEHKKDDLLSFEQLGVDLLFVDEADSYKNLAFRTKMEGVAAPNAQKSFDMLMKSAYLESINPGRGLVFATGTPIANAVAEVYTMQRYLQPKALARAGLSDFDSWAAMFGRVVTGVEMKPDTTGFRVKSRLASFHNVGELAQLIRQVMDVQRADDLPDVVRPKVMGGGMHIVETPTTADLKAYQRTLGERSDKVAKGKVDPTEDNMLKITSDGRKAALDMRLVDPEAIDDPDNKINTAVRSIHEIWKRTTKLRGTQLVFADLFAVGKDGTGLPGFNVYHEVREKLVALGVPRAEIRFAGEADNDLKKAKLKADVRAGRVRVLIGSTEKMGAGMNVQDRLVALHHLDAPHRPRDVEQRNGRIIRQGNKLYEAGEIPHVEVHAYLAGGSYDGYMWQGLDRKAGMIHTALTADAGVRSLEDVGEVVVDWATAKAIASGNPMVKEKADVDAQVQKLERSAKAFRDEQFTMNKELFSLPATIEGLGQQLDHAERDAKAVEDTTGDKFTIAINGTTVTERKVAGEMIQAAVQKLEPLGAMLTSGEQREVKLGTFAGFDFAVAITRAKFSDQRDMYFLLRGEGDHYKDIVSNASPASFVATLEAMPKKLQVAAEIAAEKLTSAQRRLAALKAKGAGGSYPKQAELDALKAKQLELQAKLNAAAAEKESAPPPATPGAPAPAPAPVTETPAFRDWFGDSKVVDAEGKPLVVYHGTQAAFDTFRVGEAEGWGKGIYFTDNRAQAEAEWGDGPTGRVVDAYVALQHPYIEGTSSLRGREDTPAWKAVEARGNDPETEWANNGRFVGNVLRDLGYDGIIADQSNGIQGREIVAFRPEQVKSATANRGTFDGGNPNMLYGVADPFTAAYKLLEATMNASRARRGLPPRPLVDLRPAGAKLLKVQDDVRKLVSPGARSPGAAQTERIVRAHNAQFAIEYERAREALVDLAKAADRMRERARLGFIDTIEAGGTQPTPDLIDAAKVLRNLLDSTRDEVIALGTGKLENWIEDYFPHIWKDPKKASAWIKAWMGGKRPIDGSKNFLRHRTIPTTAAGIAAGLEPITTNPVGLTLLKIREMRRYIMGQRIIQELKKHDLIQFVRAGKMRPDGYAKIEDRFATVYGGFEAPVPTKMGGATLTGETEVPVGGRIVRGEWMAPEPVARVLNNFLSPGMRGNALYDFFAGANNMLNQAQLGWSLFHLGFTSVDAAVSQAAVGLQHLAHGDAARGDLRRVMHGGQKMVTFPAAPLTTFLRGRRIAKAALDPAGASPELAAIVEQVIQAGGRFKQDSFYETGGLRAFMTAYRERKPGADGAPLAAGDHGPLERSSSWRSSCRGRSSASSRSWRRARWPTSRRRRRRTTCAACSGARGTPWTTASASSSTTTSSGTGR